MTAIGLVLAVHVGSFVPGLPMTPLYLAALFPLAFVAFGGMILSINRYQPRFRVQPEAGYTGFWARRSREQEAHTSLMSYAFGSLPSWMQAGCTVVVFYAMVNFIVGLALSEGQPESRDDRYWLSYKGKYVRSLTELEFRRLRAREARFFSGHMLPFTFFPCAWFVFVRPRLEQDDRRGIGATG